MKLVKKIAICLLTFTLLLGIGLKVNADDKYTVRFEFTNVVFNDMHYYQGMKIGDAKLARNGNTVEIFDDGGNQITNIDTDNASNGTENYWINNNGSPYGELDTFNGNEATCRLPMIILNDDQDELQNYLFSADCVKEFYLNGTKIDSGNVICELVSGTNVFNVDLKFTQSLNANPTEINITYPELVAGSSIPTTQTFTLSYGLIGNVKVYNMTEGKQVSSGTLEADKEYLIQLEIGNGFFGNAEEVKVNGTVIHQISKPETGIFNIDDISMTVMISVDLRSPRVLKLQPETQRELATIAGLLNLDEDEFEEYFIEKCNIDLNSYTNVFDYTCDLLNEISSDTLDLSEVTLSDCYNESTWIGDLGSLEIPDDKTKLGNVLGLLLYSYVNMYKSNNQYSQTLLTYEAGNTGLLTGLKNYVTHMDDPEPDGYKDAFKTFIQKYFNDNIYLIGIIDETSLTKKVSEFVDGRSILYRMLNATQMQSELADLVTIYENDYDRYCMYVSYVWTYIMEYNVYDYDDLMDLTDATIDEWVKENEHYNSLSQRFKSEAHTNYINSLQSISSEADSQEKWEEEWKAMTRVMCDIYSIFESIVNSGDEELATIITKGDFTYQISSIMRELLEDRNTTYGSATDFDDLYGKMTTYYNVLVQEYMSYLGEHDNIDTTNMPTYYDALKDRLYKAYCDLHGLSTFGSKTYKAKDESKTAEKISGSGKKGSTRTITPIEGKKVGRVVVTDKNGNKVEVTKNSDGTFSFIQPASDVNVEVTYVNREITLNIGSTEASVDGEKSNLDVCPVIRNDRTMLPIRFVAENLGAKVEWDEKNPNYVLITKDDIMIEITLGSDIMKVNGKDVKLDVVAFAENDRTYLPVRAVSENLNAIVEWNEQRPMEVKIYER